MKNGMLKLRATVVFLLLWLAVLFNIERLHEPINLASFVYVLAGVLAAAIVFTPKLRRATLLEIALVTIPVYAALKWCLGYSFLGPALPITVTECVVLSVTNGLAWMVAHQIDHFMRTAADMSAVRSFAEALALEEGESLMYSEVQRARRFERNLALATVTYAGELKTDDLERLSFQAHREIARKFLESRIARRLAESTSAGDLLVYHDGEFVLMFPEATVESARALLQGAVEELHKKLGLTIRVGLAQFPDEECTLTGLIERAEADAQSFEWQAEPEAVNEAAAQEPALSAAAS